MKISKIQELITNGTIKIGTKAKANPDFGSLSQFALGIANKDYSAQTPFLWNSVYKELDMRERNIRTFAEPAFAEQIFEAFRNDPDYLGGDVGVGFKDKVLGFLDDVEELAQVMGAINVVVKTPSGLKGYNTDGEGYAQSLETVLGNLSGKRVVLLGAGGTGNAIAVALAGHGAYVQIINRTAEKAKLLAERLNLRFGTGTALGDGRDNLEKKLLDASAVIACIDDLDSPLDQYSALAPITLPATPANMAANHSEAERILLSLPKETLISDVMLRPQDTATIATAKTSGLRTLDGYPMVLNQAVEAFWLVNQSILVTKGIDKSRVAKIMRLAASGSAK